MSLLGFRWLAYLGAFSALVFGLWRVVTGIETRGYNRAVAEYTVTMLKAVAEADKINQTKLNEAINASKKRETALASDASNARAVVTGLRQQLAATRDSLSGLTRPAVERYATEAGIVFGECAARYSELAEEAGRLSSDRKTLIDSWPTK